MTDGITICWAPSKDVSSRTGISDVSDGVARSKSLALEYDALRRDARVDGRGSEGVGEGDERGDPSQAIAAWP